jgi:hypothetical protein
MRELQTALLSDAERRTTEWSDGGVTTGQMQYDGIGRKVARVLGRMAILRFGEPAAVARWPRSKHVLVKALAGRGAGVLRPQ